MDDVKINTSKTLTLTLPTDADSNTVTVNVVHEFNDSVKSNIAATRTALGTYTVTLGQEASGLYVLQAAGKHQVAFTYAISGTSYTQSQYINVYTPYITSTEFFNNHPELQTDFSSKFDTYEKRARNIINTYCGQSFDYYPEKSFNLDGNNHKNLHLPLAINSLKKVTINYGQDSEEVIHDSSDPALNNVERIRQPFNFESSYYLRYRISMSDSPVNQLLTNKFKNGFSYKVEGDFGWRYVPNNVTQAIDLIIADLMNDDSEYRRHAITNISMDTTSFSMSGNFYESTGNIEADVLLMDYMMFIMDYVV